MKAIVYTEYGSPDVLHLREVDTPTPGDQEVLVRVHATSVNASDWEFLNGSPLYTRIWGTFKPKHPILGSDIAGRVEAVGSGVTRFRPGDEVFGDLFEYWGGFAEYVAAPETTLTHKPAALTFEQAAALPQAALVSLQGLRDKGKIQPGQHVLINGAGGGAGTFAVQLATAFGAHVTGVDRGDKLDLMRSLGAEQVIDYTRVDCTRTGERYDLILDLVGSHSVLDFRRALRPSGAYVMVGGSLAHILQTVTLGSLLSLMGAKKLGLLAAKPNRHLPDILEMIETGKVVPVIDQVYPLHETPEALRHLGEGRARGKVLVTMT